MRIRLLVVGLVAAVLYLTMNTPAPPASAAPMRVMVTIAPQKYFAEKLGKGLTEVGVMVPPGSSPHSYEPKPSQMASLNQAKLYFALGGMEFEEAWLPRFQAANPQLTVVDTGRRVQRIVMKGKHEHDEDEGEHREAGEHHEEGEHHDGEDEHQHGKFDPHIWTSPTTVRLIAVEMCDALIAADPVNKEHYEHNLKAFLSEISALNQEIKAMRDKIPGEKNILVYHPAWGYFCQAYGLNQIAVETEGKEPGPRGLQAVIEQAKKVNAKVVFVQPQFSRKSAQVVAEAIGGVVVPIDPLAPDWAKNMKMVAAAVRDAIK